MTNSIVVRTTFNAMNELYGDRKATSMLLGSHATLTFRVFGLVFPIYRHFCTLSIFPDEKRSDLCRDSLCYVTDASRKGVQRAFCTR